MMPKSGFVLLIVVVMLSVITGLILTQSKMIQLAIRGQYLYASYQSREAELETIAQRLVLNVMPMQARSLVLDDTMLQKQLILQGHDYDKHYRYLFTDLGDYPCMKLSGSYASHHWLLSLIDTDIPTRILQLRIASPIPEVPCIDHPVSYHTPGLLSWRSVIANPTRLN